MIGDWHLRQILHDMDMKIDRIGHRVTMLEEGQRRSGHAISQNTVELKAQIDGAKRTIQTVHDKLFEHIRGEHTDEMSEGDFA